MYFCLPTNEFYIATRLGVSAAVQYSYNYALSNIR